MKPCIKCKTMKPIDDFYRHEQMADGHINKCKDCVREYMILRRTGPMRERILAYDRERGARPHRKEGVRRYSRTDRGRTLQRAAGRRWVSVNPEKRRAHYTVSNAIRDGRMRRAPCEVCGAKAQAHHHDYSKPLEVRWLCAAHHAEEHKKQRKVSK